MKKPHIPGLFRLALTILLASQIGMGSALATELLMLEQKGCAWCVRWHQEIGEAYPNTDQGKLAPLRRVDIHDWPEDLDHIARERVTPTFVLISNNQEVARLRGYPGDHFFWPMLDDMLSQLPND
ncbi:regulatory protein SoxS [Thalassospira sp. HJ]|nr:regulatory protein SoxS [Thalassospira sp. HJ]